MLNIFSDFHHAGLLNSLIMLFEGRLGGNLYRPIGTDWHKNGFWKVFDHPATVEQYLGINGATPDGSPELNNVIGNGARIGFDGKRLPIYHCKDIDSKKTNKAITFDGFMNTHIDIVIASIPQHIEPFARLCELHPDKPILIYQVGNSWNVKPAQERLIQGVLSSAKLARKPQVPTIEYHQEFDLNIFVPYFVNPYLTEKYRKENLPANNIYSFVNCFSQDPLFAFDWHLFTRIEKRMEDWNFKTFGGLCRDGAKGGSRGVAEAMQKARFVWHTKNGGDGYGHIIHNTGAMGKPSIVRKSYYYGKLASDLMIDGETCITIDGLSDQEIIKKITHFSNDEIYSKMCDNVYNNFKAKVNFDDEANQIKLFLTKIFEYHGKSNSRLSNSNTHSD